MRHAARPFIRRWMLLVCCFLFLTAGCGFHLRGAVALPPAMESTYIAGAENSPLYYELESALLAAGGKVVEEADAATAILTIQSERYGRRVASVDSAGRASEYELSLHVLYSLRSGDGEVIARPDEVLVLRDYRFDPDNVLASGSQEETLRSEMRRYAVREILQRLSRAQEPAATASTPE
jgi:LPS-assembly lipoprotein